MSDNKPSNPSLRRARNKANEAAEHSTADQNVTSDAAENASEESGTVTDTAIENKEENTTSETATEEKPKVLTDAEKTAEIEKLRLMFPTPFMAAIDNAVVSIREHNKYAGIILRAARANDETSILEEMEENEHRDPRVAEINLAIAEKLEEIEKLRTEGITIYRKFVDGPTPADAAAARESYNKTAPDVRAQLKSIQGIDEMMKKTGADLNISGLLPEVKFVTATAISGGERATQVRINESYIVTRDPENPDIATRSKIVRRSRDGKESTSTGIIAVRLSKLANDYPITPAEVADQFLKSGNWNSTGDVPEGEHSFTFKKIIGEDENGQPLVFERELIFVKSAN